MAETVPQVITGVMPPQLGEARIRESFPSVASKPALATWGRALPSTLVFAPLAWLLMAPVYFGKLLPFLGRRYTLTNRRVMIRTLWKAAVLKEVALADIDDVRVV